MNIIFLICVAASKKLVNYLFWYLKLFEENLGESLPEVRRAEDGLDDDHSSVSRVHQQVPDWDIWETTLIFTQKKQW